MKRRKLKEMLLSMNSKFVTKITFSEKLKMKELLARATGAMTLNPQRAGLPEANQSLLLV